LAHKVFTAQLGVGKSCLVTRYLKGQFDQNDNVTVSVEFPSKMVLVEQKQRVRLQNLGYSKYRGKQIGQELLKALVRSFYQGISAVFLVYAMDKE
jgi:GTPase SAR1 family protein